MRNLMSDPDVDFAAIEKHHVTEWKSKVEGTLLRLSLNSSGVIKTYYDEILKHVPDLLTAKPTYLRSIKDNLERRRTLILDSQYKKENVTKNLLSAFNYTAFVNSELPHWGAYKYTEMLNANACVYCNRIFSFTLDRVDQARRYNKTKKPSEKRKILKNISGKTRPELDHFYPKAQYPYLALSIYNLIPSCHICNSNLKGSRKLNFDDYLHPYEDDFHELVRITPKLRKETEIQEQINKGLLSGKVNEYFGTQIFMGNTEAFDLHFTMNDSTKTDDNLKAKKHIDLYALYDLYEMHKPQAARIILNAIVHGKGAVADIYSRHKSIFRSEGEVRSAIMGNETNPDRINQSPLSKLTIDIIEDFGI